MMVMMLIKKYNFKYNSHISYGEVLSRTPPRQFSTPETDKEFYQACKGNCSRGVLFNCAKKLILEKICLINFERIISALVVDVERKVVLKV